MLPDYVECAVVPTAAAARFLLADKCCLRKHAPLLVRWQFIPSGLFAGQHSTVSSETTSTPSSMPLSSGASLMPTHWHSWTRSWCAVELLLTTAICYALGSSSFSRIWSGTLISQFCCLSDGGLLGRDGRRVVANWPATNICRQLDRWWVDGHRKVSELSCVRLPMYLAKCRPSKTI